MLVYVYIGQFEASRCTIFAHTGLDYSLSDEAVPQSGFHEVDLNMEWAIGGGRDAVAALVPAHQSPSSRRSSRALYEVPDVLGGVLLQRHKGQ
jgi:hypothetical protein